MSKTPSRFVWYELMTSDTQVAALGARPSWLGYIAVDDVDSYTEKVKAAGGRQFVAPTDIPGVSCMQARASAHGIFMPASLAGPRARPWTWGRWACTRSLPAAIRLWAA